MIMIIVYKLYTIIIIVVLSFLVLIIITVALLFLVLGTYPKQDISVPVHSVFVPFLLHFHPICEKSNYEAIIKSYKAVIKCSNYKAIIKQL